MGRLRLKAIDEAVNDYVHSDEPVDRICKRHGIKNTTSLTDGAKIRGAFRSRVHLQGNRGQRGKEERNKEIVAMRKRGVTYREIAAATGVSFQRCEQIVKRYG